MHKSLTKTNAFDITRENVWCGGTAYSLARRKEVFHLIIFMVQCIAGLIGLIVENKLTLYHIKPLIVPVSFPGNVKVPKLPMDVCEYTI